MDHAGDIAASVVRCFREGQHNEGSAGWVPGHTRDTVVLICWGHEGSPFRITVEALTSDDLSDRELYPTPANEQGWPEK